jgi:glutamate-1-semialdehyde 2,1-aminomutase
MDAERYPLSAAHMERARRVLTRGVGSAMRAVQRPTPLAIAEASGSRLVDVDGNSYVDYVLGFGPILLGHRPPAVVRAVEEQLSRGILYGAQHEGEVELAERLARLIPSAELVAFSTSGSEAIHAALRFARAATGRRLVVKFDGHYHGWLDPVHASGPALPPSSETGGPRHAVPGLPAPADLLTCRWNDLGALTRVLDEHDGAVAAVVMEPVACNFGAYEPLPGYLQSVRELCDSRGVVLIFDEVITGFRLGLGGAQRRYGVEPHLTVLAKALASGFPLSAIVGSAEVMSVADSDGPVRHIGTYNANPVSVAAANATLAELERGGDELYRELDARAARLAQGLREAAAAAGAPLVVNQVGAVLHLLWAPREPVRSHDDAYASDTASVGDVAAHLLGSGVFALERGLWFISTAHTDEDVDLTVAAAEHAIAEVVKRGSGSQLATGPHR